MKTEPTPKPLLMIVILFVGIAAVYWWRTHSTPTGPEAVTWSHDLTKARDVATQAGKPLLVYFTASWCGPCQKMRSTTWADPAVAEELSRHWIAVKIDVDEQPTVARQFNAGSIPRMQIFQSDGSPGPAKIAYVSAEEIIPWLQQARVR